jgi:D-glycero-beta-D-manno-heptose-7-phosphate kinase
LIGESCQDEYYYGECNRISPEAPVPIMDYSYGMCSPGMAANVERNLIALGCKVTFISNNPDELVKIRYIDKRSEHQLLRVDRGDRVSKSLNIFSLYTDSTSYDAIVISDYDKGLITDSFASDLCKSYTCPIFVDSKKRDLTCYQNAIIKINEFEDQALLDYDENSQIIVTRGKDGATWNGRKFSAPKVNVHDVTGAGDVFLSTLAYLYTNCRDLAFSIDKAIQMATRSVEHTGTYQIQKWDIEEVL